MRSATAPTMRCPGKSHAQAGAATIDPMTKKAAAIVLRMHALPVDRGNFTPVRATRVSRKCGREAAGKCLAPAPRFLRQSGVEIECRRRGSSARPRTTDNHSVKLSGRCALHCRESDPRTKEWWGRQAQPAPRGCRQKAKALRTRVHVNSAPKINPNNWVIRRSL